MEENVGNNDEDGKKRKRDNNNDDVNVYLTDFKRSQQGNETKDDTNNKWLSGLRWTKSPEEAKYSDWSVDVKHKQIQQNGNDEAIVGVLLKDTTTTTTTTTYSVHRCILGLHSEYFQSIFDSSFSESHQKRNTIELPTAEITLHHFEALLDYCYSGKLILFHDPLTAVAMVYFGDYLQIKKLVETAQDNIKKSIQTTSSSRMCSRILSTFYQGATSLRMEDLQDAVVRICAQQPDVMGMNSVLMSMVPDTGFWCSVWTARKYYPNQTIVSTMKWSDNAANYIHYHRSIVNSKMFHVLTDINSLPIISPDAAVSLMEQEQEFLQPEENSTLTCLQKRCIASLYDRETGIWKVSNKDSENVQKLHKRLKELPSVVSDALFVGTMEFEGTKGLCIEVSDAGSDCVNGIYTMSGLHKLKPVFIRSGLHDDGSAIFDDGSKQQYIIHSSDCHDWFYISSIPQGYELSSYRDVARKFYRQKSNGYFMPSPNGWNPRRLGLRPVPTLRSLFV